jgi:hypothetical protein
VQDGIRASQLRRLDRRCEFALEMYDLPCRTNLYIIRRLGQVGIVVHESQLANLDWSSGRSSLGVPMSELENVAERPLVCIEDGPTPSSRANALFDRMINGGESFWLAVYGPFMMRDLTRDDVRLIVRKGLVASNGNYRRMMQTFNMPAEDYMRFLNFLRKHQCQLSVQSFRSETIKTFSLDLVEAEYPDLVEA